jgi:hypothetical protein
MASTLSLSMDTPNSGLAGFVGPFESVVISVPTGGGAATITVTGLTQGADTYKFGSQGALGLNLTNTGVDLSGLSWTGGNANTAFSLGGAGTLDGFGLFNWSLNGFDGFGSSVSSLSFVLTPTSGVFTDANSVLTPNAGNGNEIAAHTFVVCGSDCRSQGASGYVTSNLVSSGPPTPEPSTLFMGILGLAAIVASKYRRQRC